MSAELVVPTTRELEALSPADRWDIEEKLDEAQDILRDFNDEELRHWVEVEGKTQAEIGEMVGRPQSTIASRCTRLDLTPKSNRGRPRINDVVYSEAEVVESEIVEDDRPTRRKPQSRYADDGRPAHHLPDVVADDAHENVRTQTLHWFEQGREVKELLSKGRPLEPRSVEDRKAIKREAGHMERLAKKIKELTDE